MAHIAVNGLINVDFVCIFQLSLFLEKHSPNEENHCYSEKKKSSWYLSCFENRVSFALNTMKDREIDADLLTDH